MRQWDSVHNVQISVEIKINVFNLHSIIVLLLLHHFTTPKPFYLVKTKRKIRPLWYCVNVFLWYAETVLCIKFLIEVINKITQAKLAFSKQKRILNSKTLIWQLVSTFVCSTLIYEVRHGLLEQTRCGLESFEMWCCRKILKIP